MEQHLTKRTDQEILEKIKQLAPRQQAEVIDFIDFLRTRSFREDALLQFLEARSEPELELEDVRRRLAKLPGSLSDTVRELRDERG